MNVPSHLVLPQVSVLGSTMAYREAGNPDAPVAPAYLGGAIAAHIGHYQLQ